MEKLRLISVPICIKIKKMYTNNEIEIIINNCITTHELLRSCMIFKFLVDEKYQEKTGYLYVKTQLRFRELEKLWEN